jgi:membrane protease YdiL (CAAX protease family)
LSGHTPTTRPAGWADRGPGIALLAVVLLSFAALALQCCAGCPLGIAEAVLHETTGLEQGRLIAHPVALAFTSVVALGTVLLLGGHLARRPLRELVPLGRFDPLLVPVLVPAVIGGCIALMELATIVEWVMPMPALLREFFQAAFGGGQSTLGSFFLAVLVAPVMEELVFRGLLLQGLRRHWPAAPAVLTTALLFALFHANPWQFMGPLLLGLFFGWLTVRSGSLWPAILAHALNNATALVTMHLLAVTADPQAVEATAASLGPLWLDLTGLACLLVGIPGCILVLRRRVDPG